MRKNKFQNGINEVKKTAVYTIPLTTLLSVIVSFGTWGFYFYLLFLTLTGLATQFVFGYLNFDHLSISKAALILLLIFFVAVAVISFGKLIMRLEQH